jgi:D-beta-D-heptose 7-phosphate kinase / D-beta-D-heptose 1-phosphate adenosyltransferase
MVRVWVNGSFDILHVGHLRMLEYASLFGEVRVGVDTDERIREKKGSDRPYNTLEDRVEFLYGLKYVTDVVTFSSDEELIEEIKIYGPDIMVIGDDYNYDSIIGKEFIPEIKFFKKIPGKSTTKILSYGKTNSL